jgi:CheY-like chemotaxis protein
LAGLMGTAPIIRHIVVVEDDADMSELMRDVLADAGHDVVTSGSGAEALAYLARVPDRCLVLLDLHMPDMNGWQVISELRQARNREHRVALVSGAPPNELPHRLPALRKPFASHDLLAFVREQLDA